jgi:hypothetical protein
VIGRTADGGRLFARIDLVEILGSHESADHDTLTNPLRFSASGWHVPYRRHESDSAGQMLDRYTVVKPAPGWTLDDIASLLAIWRQWHLNDMQAACAHMDVAGLGPSYDDRRHVVCPVTGERYGSKWWAREIPADVVVEIRRLMALPA